MITSYFFSNGKPTIYFWGSLYVVALVARLTIFFLLVNIYGTGSVYLANHGEPIVGHDTQHYMVIAHNVLELHGYSRFITSPFEPDGVRTPLYPVLLIPFLYFFGYPSGATVAVLSMNFIWALTPLLAFIVARKFVRLRYAVLVGLATAVDPLLIFRSNIAEPDALLTLLFLGTSYFFIQYWRMPERPKYLYATMAGLGLMILAKPVALYVGYALIAVMLTRMSWYNHSWRSRIKHGAISVAILLALLMPWFAYYYFTFGTVDVSSAPVSVLYTYSTKSFMLPGEPVDPPFISRESPRDPRNKKFYSNIVKRRIQSDPKRYFFEQLEGAYENIDSVEFKEIRWYKQEAIIPFNYFSLQQKLQLTDAMLKDPQAAVLSLVRLRTLLRELRSILLLFFFIVILINLFMLSNTNKQLFYLSLLFFLISLFFITHSGSVVVPKYRLPAIPLMLILFFQGMQNLFERSPHIKEAGGLELHQRNT